ncbi:Asp/Glu racemase [Deinococcus sp. KSM4-11]|uniref:aspartate/glutamate racemase family protein n=1 Tax=Deinococcus sp. KSM4-11 TaxID=2568654 RepID=UPI0010A3AE59|nr:aspartate/glutamate racemase family protein [Deinococcus sp. KSM4-11]THF85464.1 Asp/Glu racemase [Deinococcus sp. KSM4-11]
MIHPTRDPGAPPQETLALLHTTPVTLTDLPVRVTAQAPHVRVINILDDSLLADVMAAGEVTLAVHARLRAYLHAARDAGATAVMTCCSSVGAAVDALAGELSIPVLRIDRPMAAQASTLGRRVGVLATVPTTLEPTAALIEREATAASREVQVVRRVVEGAYAARVAGDGEEHDRLVIAALRELLGGVDVIVLAQASMARLLPALGDTGGVPVLSSPDSGVAAALHAVEDSHV